MTDTSNKGFTLIELSIVLVIIALLAAGIVVGQSMIRQSQINSVMTDAQNYIQVTNTFQQKYAVLPGDMASAATYWGTMTTCPPSSGSTPQGGTLTCNGDGNGQVYNSTSSFTATTVNTNEALLFWQHLSDAGLIQGNYTGIGGSAGTLDHIIGTNCPASRVDGAGFGISYTGVQNGIANTSYFSGTYGHALYFGGHTSNNLPEAAIITPGEAFNIDNKFDDGTPNTGNVVTWTTNQQANCTTLSSGVYSYATTTSSAYQCSLIIITGF